MVLAGLFTLLTLASIIYIAAWFVFGFLYLKRIDSVDSAWGLGFIYVAAIALAVMDNYETIPLLALLFTTLWGLRLFIHITSRNIKKKEDGRYAVYRKKFARRLNALIFTRIFLVQGLLIVIISTASVGAIISEDFNLTWAYAGFTLWALGIVYESIADIQLRKFIAGGHEGIMTGGLWRYSRHPNYFGEITAWTGAAIVASSGGNYWGLIGPLTIAYLIIKVSGLPPIEARYKDDPDYQSYKNRTSALVPLPPKH